ncbi:MAG TPA: VOC family protein [Propionibacteriaceae bacterium]|nr:VOC family protein [Propionibacteriaceae bacterium]
MSITIHETFLPHTDPAAAIDFYRRVLEFEVRGDVENHGLHWITVGPSRQEDISVVLYPPQVAPGITDDERQMIEAMMERGAYASLNLATSDLDAVFARLQAAGADVVQPPTEHPYGIRDCAVRDPSGNLLRIQQLR